MTVLEMQGLSLTPIETRPRKSLERAVKTIIIIDKMPVLTYTASINALLETGENKEKQCHAKDNSQSNRS
jgi:hypothetical protein